MFSFTGHVSAACISLQSSLNKPLLWSACNHHIGEIILTNLFNDLRIEPSYNSHDYSLFKRFKKNLILYITK